MLPRAICVTQTNEIEYESSSERMVIRQQIYTEAAVAAGSCGSVTGFEDVAMH